MKALSILLIMVLFTSLFAGCGPAPQSPTNPTTTPPATSKASTTQAPATGAGGTTPSTTAQTKTATDTQTTASIVNTGDAFEKAISKNGTWIVAVLNDMTINKDLVVEGDFKNDKTPPVSQRKIALYAQDANRNVTARYKLTAPKMTINSPDCSIVNGTFKGDLYVNAKNFQLIGATVDGNIYFTNSEAQSTFKMDKDSKVTGKQELKKP